MMARMTDPAFWIKDDGGDREDNEDSGAMMMQIYISVTVFMCPHTYTHTFSINYIYIYCKQTEVSVGMNWLLCLARLGTATLNQWHFRTHRLLSDATLPHHHAHQACHGASPCANPCTASQSYQPRRECPRPRRSS